MYTQCPDCEFAFKVTANDLKKAGSQVLCDACGNAFSAISYLSETNPAQSATDDDSAEAQDLPPESDDPDPSEGISPEQSAAFLKSLDEIEGSDIRIMDTGVEWRVLDEVMGVADVQRFDDNTPLPDDFDADDEPSHSAKSELSHDSLDEDEDAEELLDEEPQPGVALADPDEWKDILGEFQDLAKEVAAPIDDNDSDSDDDTAIQFGDEADDADEADDEALSDETSAAEPEDVQQNEVDISDSFENWEFSGDSEQLDLIDEQSDPEDESIVQSHAIEDELDAEIDDELDDEIDDEPPIEHYVPPMTEEEHTVNMLIDQDLMALAVEDQDGFISTIVIPEEDPADMVAGLNGSDDDNDVDDESTTTSSFETIIMEGESIRSAMESGELADAVAALGPIDFPLEDETENVEEPSGPPRYGLIAAAVLLVLALVAQGIHQSREKLATIPAFSSTIGQVYRAIGQPVQPAWDITGWRFEATKGSTEGEDDNLTVYSRLGNNSSGPLPYPLIGISLTDRFEESIGSRVLDPAEYLPSDLDPRKLVARGDTFNAVITIKSASEDATGFKLNVCYRSNDGRLRCAIDDFR